MSDFKELVHDRRVTARSAKNHVNARRGRCRLPHDNLTRKEWEKLNGEITTVNTKQPMNWEEFKALPKGLQETYFNTVIDTYNCGLKGMAGMFGVSAGGLSQYIRTHGLNTSPQKKGRKPNNREWEEFLSGEKRKPPVVRWSVTVAAQTWEEVFEAVKHFPIYAGVTISVE